MPHSILQLHFLWGKRRQGICHNVDKVAISDAYAQYGTDYMIGSEQAMSQLSTAVKMTKTGIGFSVCVEFVNRECFISNEALIKLAAQMFAVIGPMQTFRELEANIAGVARRLVRAGVQGSPLQLTPNTFQ